MESASSATVRYSDASGFRIFLIVFKRLLELDGLQELDERGLLRGDHIGGAEEFEEPGIFAAYKVADHQVTLGPVEFEELRVFPAHGNGGGRLAWAGRALEPRLSAPAVDVR